MLEDWNSVEMGLGFVGLPLGRLGFIGTSWGGWKWIEFAGHACKYGDHVLFVLGWKRID